MGQTTAISGNSQKNRGGTILNAGNVPTTANRPNVTNNLSLSTNAFKGEYGSRPFLAVSPGSSGNVGTIAPISGGVFADMEKGKYIGYVWGHNRIAQTTNTALKFTSRTGKHYVGFINAAYGGRRLHITSWNAVTGAATKGGNAGDREDYGRDDAVALTDAVPGELTYMTGSLTPTQDNYKARTNP